MPVIFISYSGGFVPTAWALRLGHLKDRLRGIVLMDSLYGELEHFEKWILSNRRGFFISGYLGSTRARNLELQRDLGDKGIKIAEIARRGHQTRQRRVPPRARRGFAPRLRHPGLDQRSDRRHPQSTAAISSVTRKEHCVTNDNEAARRPCRHRHRFGPQYRARHRARLRGRRRASCDQRPSRSGRARRGGGRDQARRRRGHRLSCRRVARDEEIARMVALARDTYGHVDIAVSNVGKRPYASFLDITPQDWDDVIRTNLSAAFLSRPPRHSDDARAPFRPHHQHLGLQRFLRACHASRAQRVGEVRACMDCRRQSRANSAPTASPPTRSRPA